MHEALNYKLLVYEALSYLGDLHFTQRQHWYQHLRCTLDECLFRYISRHARFEKLEEAVVSDEEADTVIDSVSASTSPPLASSMAPPRVSSTATRLPTGESCIIGYRRAMGKAELIPFRFARKVCSLASSSCCRSASRFCEAAQARSVSICAFVLVKQVN